MLGVYPTHESADAAVDASRTKGFRSTDISVLFPQNVVMPLQPSSWSGSHRGITSETSLSV